MLESNDDNELSANDVFSHAVTTVQTTDSPLCSFQLSIGSATEIFTTENGHAVAEPLPASGAAEQPPPAPPQLPPPQSEPPAPPPVQQQPPPVPGQQLQPNEFRELARK